MLRAYHALDKGFCTCYLSIKLRKTVSLPKAMWVENSKVRIWTQAKSKNCPALASPKAFHRFMREVLTATHNNGPSPNTALYGKHFKPQALKPSSSYFLLMRIPSSPRSSCRVHRKAALLLQDPFILIKVKCLRHRFHPQTINISGLLLSPGWQR